MEKAQLLALHDRWQRIEIEHRTMRREATPEVIRHVHLRDGEGTILFSRLTAESADRAIQAQIDYFRKIGQDFEWKTYDHDAPGDLEARLLAHGLAAEDPESLLVLEIDTAPPSLLQPVAHDIRRVADPAELDAIHGIQERVWGESDPAYITALKDELVQDPDHVSIFLAYADGVPVAHARISYHGRSPFAGLWGGSTLQEHRGRGFYTSLLAVRLQEARDRRLRFLTIDASPMSRPIVEKHGFQFLARTRPYMWRTTPT